MPNIANNKQKAVRLSVADHCLLEMLVSRVLTKRHPVSQTHVSSCAAIGRLQQSCLAGHMFVCNNTRSGSVSTTPAYVDCPPMLLRRNGQAITFTEFQERLCHEVGLGAAPVAGADTPSAGHGSSAAGGRRGGATAEGPHEGGQEAGSEEGSFCSDGAQLQLSSSFSLAGEARKVHKCHAATRHRHPETAWPVQCVLLLVTQA